MFEISITPGRQADWLPSLQDPVNPDGPWRAADLRVVENPSLAGDLAVLGWRRWQLATESLFLFDACELVDSRDPLALAITSSLVAFRGYPISFSGLGKFFSSVDEVLDTALNVERKVITPHPLSADRVSLAKDILHMDKEGADVSSIPIEGDVEKMFLLSGVSSLFVILFPLVQTAAAQYEIIGLATPQANNVIQVYASGPESKVAAFIRDLTTHEPLAKNSQIEEKVLSRDYFPRSLFKKINRKDLRSVLLFLLGPDPLEMLARRVIGLPDNLPT